MHKSNSHIPPQQSMITLRYLKMYDLDTYCLCLLTKRIHLLKGYNDTRTIYIENRD